MSYGSWLNTYICSLSFRLPNGTTIDGRGVGGNTKACQ